MDGAVMFMGRLVSDPVDVRIFGRAVAMEHRPGRDDATPEEIAARPWKERWPCYVRVHDAEFIDGTMADGISLNEFMGRYGSNAWASTIRRTAETGTTDIDPRKSLAQQSQLELGPDAIRWLNERLNACLDRHGRISQERLDKLDWPEGSRVRR